MRGGNSTNLWTHGFVLKWEDLHPGDIILQRHCSGGDETSRDVVSSQLIRRATRGEYSHAMLAFHRTIIHAEPPGVFSTNPQRLVAVHEDDFCVLRCRTLTDLACLKLESFARQKIGSLYHISIAEALKLSLKIKILKAQQDGRQFCSRFVAQAYKAANIELVEDANYCTPGEFLHGRFLEKVPDMVRVANHLDLEIVNSRPDYVRQHFNHTFMWLEVARTCAKKAGNDVQTVGDAIRYAMDDKTADAKIAEAIEASGYLTDWQDEKRGHLFRYAPLDLIGLIGAKRTTLADEILSAVSVAVRRSPEFHCFKQWQRLYNVVTIDLHVDLYSNLVRDACERLEVMVKVALLCNHMIPALLRIKMICESVLNGETSADPNALSSQLEDLEKEVCAYVAERCR